MRSEKREIACCCGTHVFRRTLWGSQSQMVSTCEGVGSWDAREKTFRASYMNPSTGGIFFSEPISPALYVNTESLTRLRRDVLTAFKTENPDARKKTKLYCRSYHFSSLPSSFSHDRFKRHNQVPPGDSSAKSWLAGKLIRSIRCERHVRKHVDNEACNFVF